MNLLNNIEDKLSSAGFAEWQYNTSRIAVTANPMAEGVWNVSDITVERPYPLGSNLGQYANMLVEKLNSPSNPVGKGWQILEAADDHAILVSAAFRETEKDYRSYHVTIDQSGISFKQYKYRKGLETPWRLDDSATLLSDHFDALLRSLLEV